MINKNKKKKKQERRGKIKRKTFSISLSLPLDAFLGKYHVWSCGRHFIIMSVSISKKVVLPRMAKTQEELGPYMTSRTT